MSGYKYVMVTDYVNRQFSAEIAEMRGIKE